MSADNQTYDKLGDIIQEVIRKSIERDTVINGRHLRDQILDAIWPELTSVHQAHEEVWSVRALLADSIDDFAPRAATVRRRPKDGAQGCITQLPCCGRERRDSD